MHQTTYSHTNNGFTCIRSLSSSILSEPVEATRVICSLLSIVLKLKSFGEVNHYQEKMKFMKLGTRPDTFHTEGATRTLISDISSDLTIRVNDITYHLHKFSLLPKCGLLQRLSSENDVAIDLHDVPGGEEAFEVCAKFCYGINISLGAYNLVSTLCAAKFLKMTEAVESGNLVTKLEAFFSSCILEGWKDSVVTLQNAARVYEWSENLGIVRRCLESIVDKILTPPAKVTWSYTYTRPGYKKKHCQTVPKDWWTEDISFLDIDMFRCIITTIKSANTLQPQLIGEALHVYASRWLLTDSQASSAKQDPSNSKRRILETIVSLIPADKSSVSVKFLLKLLSISNSLRASPATKAELVRLTGSQLDEAATNDLLVANNGTSYDIDLVKVVLHSFLRQWKRTASAGESQSLRSIHKVGKLIDSYLQAVAKDGNMPVKKVASLIEALPAIARPGHDDLYKAISIYLKVHPEVSKEEKKQLCGALDCQKLSPEVRAHAVKNELLPLRTVVQLLFFEQETSKTTTTNKKHTAMDETGVSQHASVIRDNMSKLQLSPDEKSNRERHNNGSTSGVHQKQQLRSDSQRRRTEIREIHPQKNCKGRER